MKRLLIANRGEIAARIIRTCKRLGIETIAVYSDADQELPYIKDATLNVRIGEPPSQKSYMNQDVILETAKKYKADAIHPGYGFLSENASFAESVLESGLTFIGPKPYAIRAMGDKIQARQLMKQAGVPIVDGSEAACETVESAVQLANEIGYPVMLKASAGGGGIGMQVCENEQVLRKAFATNAKRAQTYFGNASMFVEKVIENGRHIEIQIVADSFGNVVHLFERDCSVQRRNQKVIEESPSPFLSDALRERMAEAAIRAAKAVDYCNAGTVEFIVAPDESFYFLEMNTRLQVEHPVTELITGEDLVEWQIRVAEGNPLPKEQHEISRTGHAIECRLYAEDPQTFLPSPGKLKVFSIPEKRGIRIDQGYEEGNTVTPFYDPMIAKIIASGETRDEAIDKALAFFEAMKIEGIKTNAPLFVELLKESDFKRGHYTTQLLNSRRNS
ncbi:acetyl-CoA carboxylase biotin carboxylase subunit [Pullulanibacillus sp. KACC 23026]|uniref:acetyl-CoA carboxylase biotin carboxylase subunit n=1 Tax=Pullulanibacillus sp. KACC 23026 TaxID=3028315 RepID=UPI0023AF6F2C|nr:acetyl-CoA carboxylase biotin carboxylase subunit [Pullulanibacillus sp. KACC 23026]WEG11675.1 acetyl-CoA carboxylase biotin carboxylase subunit [Pullulanibacillus sp. KACC 23026]